jgi:hypothetical protein
MTLVTRRTLAAFLFAVVCGQPSTAAGAEFPWQEPGFSVRPIPKEWIPEGPGQRPANSRAFANLDHRDAFPQGFRIPRFIELFGMPDKYYAGERKKNRLQHYLVYTLKSGEVVYVDAIPPPSDRFAYAIVTDRDGKRAIHLIK